MTGFIDSQGWAFRAVESKDPSEVIGLNGSFSLPPPCHFVAPISALVASIPDRSSSYHDPQKPKDLVIPFQKLQQGERTSFSEFLAQVPGVTLIGTT